MHKTRLRQFTRRAVILAAGVGSRLYPLTSDRPKAMVWMLGEPALHRSIRLMARHGIVEVIVVVGYGADLLRQETGEHFAGANVSYVVSHEYARTGTAVSLFRALSFMTEDTIVLEADVLFEEQLLQRVLQSDTSVNLAAVAEFKPPLSGTVVTLSEEKRVTSFTRGVSAGDLPGTFKTVNLYRFSHAFITEQLARALETASIRTPCAYLEDILATLVATNQAVITGIDCTDCVWFEVDDAADLEYGADRSISVLLRICIRPHSRPESTHGLFTAHSKEEAIQEPAWTLH